LTPCPGCLVNGFYASADANGDCQVIGSDVSRLVEYFRGRAPISYCPDFPPSWLPGDELPAEQPDIWPGCE
jgi:hypothetical protein